MPEKINNKIEEFLQSLNLVIWRIKYHNNWYELRISNRYSDTLFLDKKGELFGIPNSQINFFVFKSGKQEVAEWIKPFMKEFFEPIKEYISPSELYRQGFMTYDAGFVQYLLTKRGIVITDADGVKEKKWTPEMIF